MREIADAIEFCEQSYNPFRQMNELNFAHATVFFMYKKLHAQFEANLVANSSLVVTYNRTIPSFLWLY